MNYDQRLKKVIDYIGQHLDEKLTLAELSDVACFSKYHFHRLFTIYTGLSLQQYIRWLRLKRAAHQLLIDKDRSIIDIAINAGFESHEAFTRAFKQASGKSPKAFRLSSSLRDFEKPAYCLPQKTGDVMNDVSIKEVKGRRLAAVEHRGSPEAMAKSLNQLMDWAKSQAVNVMPKAGEAFGFAYNDPKQTKPDEFRFDLCLTVPENLKLEGAVIEKHLPSGRYAVAIHRGSHDNIGDTVYGLYRDWLPNSGEELGDLPCIFCYHNFAHEVAETELLTECWLLLKD